MKIQQEREHRSKRRARHREMLKHEKQFAVFLAHEIEKLREREEK